MNEPTLKILLYTHYWLPEPGGVQTIVMGLADGFTRWSLEHTGDKLDVTIVTQTPAGKMDDAALPFKVVRRPGLVKLIELFRSADVVHVANPALRPILLGWLLHKKVAIEHDGYQSICPNGLLLYQPDYSICPGHFMARNWGACLKCNSATSGKIGSVRLLASTFLRRWLASQATVHVAPTEHIKKRVALQRTQVIRHGVHQFVVSENAAHSNNVALTHRFAYVGRLVREKGVSVFLQACHQLAKSGHRFTARVIGDGPERKNLERESSDLGLQEAIEFVGAVPPSRISQLLTEVGIVVMPSIWEDVAPMVAIEQMIQGRLVVASDVGGLGEIVDQFGLKFPVGDARALTACLQSVLDHPEKAKELGERARKYALATYSEERTIEQHIRLYQNIMKGYAKGFEEVAGA